ncbi:MAG: radical SAM protein [Ignisphaera sp.]|nr:radical SAM protein [Ignisphaera sp.]
MELARIIESKVSFSTGNTTFRMYYRFRASRFYRGSATADTVGCNLRCLYCWSWRFNSKLEGVFYSPKDVASKLVAIAEDKGYKVVRISGGEPTIAFTHLIQVLEHLQEYLRNKKSLFVLETNGILIGYRRDYAELLSRFSNIAVRISIKGCSEEEFEKITGADKVFFSFQLQALKNLLDHNIKVWPVATISFCSAKSLASLLERLARIDENLVSGLEYEYFKAYPASVKRLCKAGLLPWLSILVEEGRVLNSNEFGELCRKYAQK